MLGMTKAGVVCDFCKNDAANCGLAKLNCDVYCGFVATRSALTAAARNMFAEEDRNERRGTMKR